jgi:general secretion pathway protein F
MSVQVFRYHACDATGQMSIGRINAESKADALGKLRSQSLTPVRLELAGSETSGRGGRRIKATDLADFTTSLAILTEARVPLDKALGLLNGISSREEVRNLVVSLRQDIKEGKSLAEAMSRFPRVFSRLYVSLVKAGEAGGILHKLLPELAEYIETSEANKKAVISALTYPAVLVFVGFASIAFLLFFIVPMFTDVFEGVGLATPRSAQVLMSVSSALKHWAWTAIPAVLALFYAWSYQGSTPERRVIRDAALLRVPILGDFLRYRDSAIFSRTLGALLQAGIPLLTALRIARDGLFNASLSAHLARVEEDVRGGAALGRSISQGAGFPLLLGQLITIGEESGRTAQILLKLAGIFDAFVRDQMKRFVGILQPTLIIFMGIMVGGIVVVMLSAVFSINTLDF